MSAAAHRASTWAFAPLGDVFDVIGGGTPSKQETSYYGGRIPWATIRDMHSSQLSSTEHCITALGLKHSSSRLIPAGEVIMASRVGLGKASILMQDTAINQDIRALIPRNGCQMDRKFVLYWLQSVSETIVSAGAGATVLGITLPFIKGLQFPVISFDKQKGLVDALDRAFAALDRARANADANLEDLEALKTSIVESEFADRENWSKETLGTRVRFIDYRGRTPEKSEAGIPLITAKNVRMGYLKDVPREFIAKNAYASWMTRGIPKRGDILFTTEAPLANVAQIETDEPIALAQRLIAMQAPAAEIDPRFLKWSLMSPQMQGDIKDKGTGATVTGIKASLLRNIPFYIPDPDRQQRIANVCEAAFHSCAKLRSEIEAKLADIIAVRQSLLQAAFSGQLT